MKKQITLSVITFMLFILQITAQEIQGKATYKSHTKLDLKLDSTMFDSGIRNQIMAQMKKQFEKSYELTFNKSESIFKEEEKLEKPNTTNIQFISSGSSASSKFYKNIKEQLFVNQTESFSKLFLIKDKLDKLDWTLINETKNIGDYMCYKATLIRKVPDSSDEKFTINSTSKKDVEQKMKDIKITAWYTLQIPVSNGPRDYQGLPGLILEVSDGSETLICNKIVLNPKEQIEISKPKKGKELTQDAYNKIMDKKVKEMMEMHNNSNDSEVIKMSIGG